VTFLPGLKLENVRVEYDGAAILHDVNLTILGGSAMAIVGANGAGKTTLFNVISGLVVPICGRVRFGATVLSDLTISERARHHISRSFQVPKLCPELTCIEHLLLSFERKLSLLTSPVRPLGSDAAKAAAIDILGELQISSLADVAVGELAHAHRKAVEIASTLAVDTQLLLLDEPTSGVGELEKQLLSKALLRRTPKMTILIIEHDEEFVRDLGWNTLIVEGGQVRTGPNHGPKL
jgi:branched-chain amino acid transport system ATP-binding protein